jgi:hypothetical protein
MTQEELDALMGGGVDLDAEEAKAEEEKEGQVPQNATSTDAKDYRVSPDADVWPPPPPTEEHKVVHQLDEVTQDSEKKASEIFDILEDISNISMDMEEDIGSIKTDLSSIKDTFEKLNQKFPNINTFKESLQKIEAMQEKSNSLEENFQTINDQTMQAMDIMQFQDIHRQKIERVVNVMRLLARYMNSLFEGAVDDGKRVSSAVHIHGDSGTEDVVNEEDIDALIEAFGKK